MQTGLSTHRSRARVERASLYAIRSTVSVTRSRTTARVGVRTRRRVRERPSGRVPTRVTGVCSWPNTGSIWWARQTHSRRRCSTRPGPRSAPRGSSFATSPPLRHSSSCIPRRGARSARLNALFSGVAGLSASGSNDDSGLPLASNPGTVIRGHGLPATGPERGPRLSRSDPRSDAPRTSNLALQSRIRLLGDHYGTEGSTVHHHGIQRRCFGSGDLADHHRSPNRRRHAPRHRRPETARPARR